MSHKQKLKAEKKVVNATVISQEILRKAVEDYLHQNKIITKESTNFSKIKVLSLSFLNIWKIQYLDSLVRLEKLQLDNNVIEKIENLDHLVHLKWLDLSFNNIRTIEGLDKLVNLTDLSLYNNHISVLGGLNNCSKLNIFSIGNNQITTFEEIISYFGRVGEKKTRFKYLQVLNVLGNPFTFKEGVKDEEYEYYLISHLPNLRYLDYIFIDEKKRKDIWEEDQKFRTQDQGKFLNELKAEEGQEKLNEEQKKKKERAKMHLLDGFSEDIVRIEDLEKIQKMRGLDDQIQKFTLKVKELVEAMQKKIKEQNEKKIEQIKISQQKLQERQKFAESKSFDAIEKFQNEYKNSLKKVENPEIYKNWRDQIPKIEASINELKRTLMNIELELTEDTEYLYKNEISRIIEEENKKLQSILSDEQKDEKGEEIGYFKKIQEEIKDFGNKLEKISRDQIDHYTQLEANGEADQEYGDSELVNYLANKETMPSLISSIKEMLVEKKGKKESEIDNELCMKQKDTYKKQYDDRQYERNRRNISNINQKIAKLFKELSSIKQRAIEDEDD